MLVEATLRRVAGATVCPSFSSVATVRLTLTLNFGDKRMNHDPLTSQK